MLNHNDPTAQWLKWAKEVQAIAQNGLTYSSDRPFDAQRYESITRIGSGNDGQPDQLG